jgi:hypothetical protein
MQEKYLNTVWLEMIQDPDELRRIGEEVWKENIEEKQFTYTGNIHIDFDKLLSISPEQEPFHTPSVKGIAQTRHDGMIKNNDIGRYELESDHEIHSVIKQNFNIEKTQAILNVQSPGSLCGAHVDKHRPYVTKGTYDFSKTLTKDIYRGILFCSDWQVGQVFIVGNECISNWKQGDTFTFPWYMYHGSANASSKKRHLVQFMGELTK